MANQPVSIIVPVYNEARAIAQTHTALRDVLTHLPEGSELIYVDDGSRDGTANKLAVLEGATILTHRSNRGYGRALKTGVRAAQNPVVCFCDADGTYPTDRLPELCAQLESEGAAMVVGARSVSQQSWARRPAKAFLRWLAEYLTQERIPDLNSGLRAIRREHSLRFERLLPEGFSYTTTITLSLLCEGERVCFTPIEYRPRLGSSKIKPIRDTANFFLLILRTTVAFHPLRVYGPIAAALLGFGALLLLARMFLDQPAGVATTVVLLTAGLQLLGIGLLADLVNRRSSR